MMVGSQRHVPAALSPGKRPVPTVVEARWATVPILTGTGNFAPTVVRSTNRPGHTDYATQGCVSRTDIRTVQ
jgi:hypothetical protein